MGYSKKKLVIFDIDTKELLSNKVFDKKISFPISHTYEPVCYLFEEAKKANIDFVTPDIYLDKKIDLSLYDGIFLISVLQSGYTKILLEDKKITPLLLTCLESPFIATRFYLKLKWISAPYRYSMVFSGMKRCLSSKTKFLSMYFPNAPKNSLNDTSFEDKKLICYIAGNKYQKNFFKNLLLKICYGFNIHTLYGLRYDVLDVLSKVEGFDLYGFGWDKNEKYRNVYKGKVEDKRKTQSKYRFCLCLENSCFPGYVTEKIIDAMLSGSVPVYAGAPDIENFVDKDCFIDIYSFSSNENLVKYLSSMKKEEYQKYQDAIKRYLHSDKFYKFTQEYFAKSIIEIINKE